MRHIRFYLPLAIIWTLTIRVTGPPVDQPPHTTLTAREGLSTLLPCDLAGDRGDRTTRVVEWLHRGLVLPIFIKFGVHPPRIDAAYLGRLSLQDGASLRVEHLRSEDGGWYQCRILLLSPPYDNLNGTWVHLSVTTPPTFRRTSPPVMEVRLGGSVHLFCEAVGHPEPLVTWSKDGKALPVEGPSNGGARYTVTNDSLRLESVDSASAGLFACEAHSEFGNATHVTELLVQGPPEIVQPPMNLTVNATQDAFLTCEAKAYPANLTYFWFKDGTSVHHLRDLRARASILTDGSLAVKQTAPGDSGVYSCVPSNGLGEPPNASAVIAVLHPAFTRGMPQVTLLAAGLSGQIPCPTEAHPPLLYVNWRRNGADLDINKLPGWYLDDAGTIVIATVNDNALGEYSCTPYNTHGTLGESDTTHVILKDPPRFVEKPAEKYEQEVGSELRIGCSATGDPQPVVNWSKPGRGGNGRFLVLNDGTMVFRPLSKEHHGLWTCEAINTITQISVTTKVVVLGTSPHKPTNLTVRSDVFGINVSWVPGFDGGHDQQFSVWFRQASRGTHDWTVRKVVPGQARLCVGGLWPETGYQFSVLGQSDRGSGPFSEIVTGWTLSVPVTTAPPRILATEKPRLPPPRGLAANRTARGLVLSWAAPPARPALAYRLEFRREGGGWAVMHSPIPAPRGQLLLGDLVQDCNYQFRLTAFSGDLISDPSNIINISTSGMAMYPSGTEVQDPLARSIRAGIIAGGCFLATAFLASVLVSCIMSRRRARRQQLDVPIIFSRYQKTPQPVRSDSLDSVVKLKLDSPGYETFERSRHSPGKGGDGREAQCGVPPGGLESISRGPDGRFMVERQRPAPETPRFLAPRRGTPGGAALGPRVVGQPRGGPGAFSLAVATSSPSGGSPPPAPPDLSPIGPCPGPQPRPGPPARSICQAPEVHPGLLPPWSFARPALLAPSAGTVGSPAPDSSGFHSAEGSQRPAGDRSHVKRDFSGDENYEWDVDFAVKSEILEALRLYKCSRPSRPNSNIVLQELQGKGPGRATELRRSLEHLNPSRQSRSSAASRCAALREEFLEYRSKMQQEDRALGTELGYDERLEQATLL